MTKLWREPLVQFVALGALLFAGNAVWERAASKADYTINVTTAELERQATIFAGENRRQPTDEDLKALLFAHVEEQVLMREAEKLGLGEDDTIIKRRLAQKMRFMIEDVDTPPKPNDAALEKWFEQNKARFIAPERRAFTHVYLSPEGRKDTLEADAKKLLAEVKTGDWKKLGDPFMMRRDYEPVTRVDVKRLFGQEFAASLFELKDNMWQGPVESAFGLHIVRASEITPRNVPDFETARMRVLAVYADEQKRTRNNERLKELIGKYKVNVDGID